MPSWYEPGFFEDSLGVPCVEGLLDEGVHRCAIIGYCECWPYANLEGPISVVAQCVYCGRTFELLSGGMYGER